MINALLLALVGTLWCKSKGERMPTEGEPMALYGEQRTPEGERMARPISKHGL